MIGNNDRRAPYRGRVPMEVFIAQQLAWGVHFIRLADGQWKCVPEETEVSDEDDYLISFEDVSEEDKASLNRLVISGGLFVIEASALDRSRRYGKTPDSQITHSKFQAELANMNAQLFSMDNDLRQNLRDQLSKVEAEIQNEEDQMRTLKIVERMVRGNLGAVSCFDGHESCWFELRPLARTGSSFVIKATKIKVEVGYEAIHRGCYDDCGLLAQIPINEKEVFLPTRKAFEKFGVAITNESIVAPTDHRKTHADWRRARWTKIARQEDVRIEVVKHNPRDWGDEDREPLLGYELGDTSVEGGAASNTIAAWREGGPVKFWREYSTALDPFQANEYDHIDDLVKDLLADGRFVTDFRRVVGHCATAEDIIAKLDEGMLLQDGHRPVLMFPRINNIHGDLISVDERVARTLIKANEIIIVDQFKTDYTHVYMYARPEGDLAKKAPPTPKTKRKRDRSKIVARDDDGKSITMNDLNFESYQRPLDGWSFNLLPSFDFQGSDDDWNHMQLIEQVKERRRRLKAEPDKT